MAQDLAVDVDEHVTEGEIDLKVVELEGLYAEASIQEGRSGRAAEDEPHSA